MALIARDLSLEIKESIDFVCISSISDANPCSFFNSVLDRFDLIKDSASSTTVSPAISSVLQQFYNQEYQYFQD